LFATSEMDIKGRLVINAGGPWADQIAGRIGIRAKPRLRMTKGIHFICPPLSEQALVLFSTLDNRLFFVVPWLGQSLIGTTDTDYSEDPGDVRAQIDEVNYLLKSISPFIPSISRERILYSYAGVRALVPEDGAPSSISRMHRVIDETQNGSPGVLSLIGGKITGYRAIAEQSVDMACALLGLRRECKTADAPLPGSQMKAHRKPDLLDEKTAQHLSAVYGSRAGEVVDLAESNNRFRAPLAQGYPDIAAQVVYSIRKEQCLRATDFLMRRTLMGFSPDQGRRALPAVIAHMAEELNWPASRQEEEFDLHMQWVRETKIDD